MFMMMDWSTDQSVLLNEKLNGRNILSTQPLGSYGLVFWGGSPQNTKPPNSPVERAEQLRNINIEDYQNDLIKLRAI